MSDVNGAKRRFAPGSRVSDQAIAQRDLILESSPRGRDENANIGFSSVNPDGERDAGFRHAS